MTAHTGDRIGYAKSARRGRPPELLTEHLAAALAAVDGLARRVGELPAAAGVPDATGAPGGFWQAVRAAAVTHDLGKVATGFQEMVLRPGRGPGWGQRHELLSVGFLPALLPDPAQRRWVASAVLTHHRPLAGSDASIAARYRGMSPDDLRDDLGPVPGPAVRAALGWVRGRLAAVGIPAGAGSPVPDGAALVTAALAVAGELWDHWDRTVDRDTGLAAVLLQGALTLADHLSSAHGALHTVQPLGDGFPARLAARLGGADRLHPHQRECAGVDGHLLLRSPTGSGKTEAGLLWTAGQVARLAATGGTPRVFVTLPYLASVNAMVDRLGGLLGDRDLVGVAHSRAASYHLARAIAPADEPGDGEGGAGGGAGTRERQAAAKAVSRAAATRLFRETVRVTTPYQLLRAALAGPAHSSVLVDTANSVIVLDELHAYDPRRLGYILASAALWERLGCRIAVLSATLPSALAGLLRETLAAPPVPVVGPPTPPRHRLRMREHALTDEATVAEIGRELAAGRSVLVVANNVAHAQRLYDDLAPAARAAAGTGDAAGDEDAAILLHSRFRRGDRDRIERRLAARYAGTGRDRRPGLVVATQVVEVSLDLDLDTLYTAGAPLEALLQRFGRVNRRGHRPPADVVICPPGYGPRRGRPAGPRYADGVYRAEPVEAGLAILARHDGREVDESQATGWLDEVYAGSWGGTWSAEVTEYRDRFDDRFLAFGRPLDCRAELEDAFDEMFEGTEAVLAADRDEYAARLAAGDPTGAGRQTAAGRLLAADLLIPLPAWGTPLSRYDRGLRVPVIDGEYHPERGLLSARPVGGGAPVYRPGEVI